MAHFAEVDNDNNVVRVLVIDNNFVNQNGGDLSESAAKAVENIVPFTTGVKWIQTSYNNNFRKQYADVNGTFNPIKNIFIKVKPFPSWTLNDNDDWKAPIAYPSITTYGDNVEYRIYWDEDKKRWLGLDKQDNEFAWYPNTSSWMATGN